MAGPYGPITNRIVTRGMGPHINRLICQGYGGPPSFVIEAIKRRQNLRGRSARHVVDQLEEVVIWAKLIEVDGDVPESRVEGLIRVKVSKSPIKTLAEHVYTRVKKLTDTVKIWVKRIK